MTNGSRTSKALNTIYRNSQPMTKISISAVVITRNEQQNLPGFLDNLGSVASEIIIVDDSSTDKTAEIAKAACRYRRGDWRLDSQYGL